MSISEKQTVKNSKNKPRLEQLDGFRFLVAFWLVIAHNFDPQVSPVGGFYERFCVRRYAAVCFFIVLSGFVSQYAYGDRDFSSFDTLRKFYLGRIGSILACYYVTMALSIILRMAAGHYTWSHCIKGSILSFFLIQTWIPKYAYFGNTPAWTLSTLVSLWLVYPWIQRRLKRATDQTLKWGVVFVPILSLLPAVLFLVFGGSISGLNKRRYWYILYTFPAFRFAGFFFGSILAEIFLRSDKTTRIAQISARIADLAWVLVFVLILAVPLRNRLSVYDTLLIEAPMGIFGFIIYSSSISPKSSIIGYVMSLEPCQKLGDFAFQVYLWRWPLFAAILWYGTGNLSRGWMALSWAYFLPSIVVLYVISYLWYVYVDTPIRIYLSKITKPSTTELATELIDEQDDKTGLGNNAPASGELVSNDRALPDIA